MPGASGSGDLNSLAAIGGCHVVIKVVITVMLKLDVSHCGAVVVMC